MKKTLKDNVPAIARVLTRRRWLQAAGSLTLVVADSVKAIGMRRQSGSGSPSVSIASPAAGSTVSGPVPILVQASDSLGIRQVALSIDGGAIATLVGAPYAFTWDSTSVPDGTVTLTASVTNVAGNSSSTSTTLVVANRQTTTNTQRRSGTAQPSVAIVSPQPGTQVSGTVSVVVSASSSLGIDRVELRVDSVLVGTSVAAPFVFSWDSTSIPDGPATLVASAFDVQGHTASAVSNVTVLNAQVGGGSPSWYTALPINAWGHLPVTTVGDEVCSDANPAGIVWPSTSVAENYDPSEPLVAGKHPIPGVAVFSYIAFSGGRMIENLTFVRDGVTHTGNYWVRYGGGHEGSADNSVHAIGPFNGTPKRINITDPSIPPAIDLVSDGIPKATWAPDGRPGAAEAYNSFAYIRSSNTLVVGQGAGYKEAQIALYAYRLSEDGGTDYPVDAQGTYMTPPTGWIRDTNYWPTVTFPGQAPIPVESAGINLTQECAWMTDNVRGEVWVIPTNTSTPFAYKALVAQGSTFSAIEVTNLDQAASGSFFKKGWAIEGESWLVFMQEHMPTNWWVIDRDARNSFGRLQAYPVTFTGDPLPNSTVSQGNNQPTAGAAFDYEKRCFYVWFVGNDPNVVLRDVYKIVPPASALDSTPWSVTKITPAAGITPEAPWGGIHYRTQTGETNVGGWSAYGNFEFVPSPTRGLFYHHRLDVPPLFWRLPA